MCAFFACFAGFSAEARAVEKQEHLGVSAGASFMTTNGGTSPGGIDLGLHYAYGITDAFTLIAEVDASAFFLGTKPSNPAPEPGYVATSGVGAVYVFDVLRWVPYAGGAIGPAYFGGGWLNSGFVSLDAHIVAGLDYEVTRSFTVGGYYRQHFFLDRMNTYPEFTSAGLRVEYVWGW